FLKSFVEKSGIDGLVNGVGRFVNYSSRQLRLLQSGQVGNYILFMVLSIAVLFLVFWNQDIIIQYLQKIF
ncbi:MAG: NADH-quinone oxidoreductase subunit L, partial [Panacibacter sp.]